MAIDLRQAVDEAGLGRWSEWIVQHASRSMRLVPDTSGWPSGSHLGGIPLMPAAVEWPVWKSRPQSLIAQIRLSELADDAATFGLPEAGLLTFFYDSEQSTWGFDPSDAGSFRVDLYPEDVAVDRRPPPGDLGPHGKFRHVPVAFRTEWTVPQYGSLEIRIGPRGEAAPEGLPHETLDMDALSDLEELLGGAPLEPRHRMFGYPDQIQNEMRSECELVTNGIYTGDGSYAANPRRAELEAAAAQWNLLLQIDSDERLGTEWGDVGRIYYWIRADALASQAFDRAWLVLQCT